MNLLTLEAPPLRARQGDAGVLSSYFLGECAHRYGTSRKSLSETTTRWFEEYPWPGNVRELENLVHRECLLSDGDELVIGRPCAAANAGAVEPARVEPQAASLSYRVAKSRAVQEFDRTYLTRLIEHAHGNVTRAAQLAGKERRAFGKLLKRYQICAAGTRGDEELPR